MATLPQPQAPRASLLGLPIELRYPIFDAINDAKFHHRTNLKMDSHPVLPLRNLARSCKSVALDIRLHRLSLPTSERYAVMHASYFFTSCDYVLTRAPRPATHLHGFKLVVETNICYDDHKSILVDVSRYMRTLFVSGEVLENVREMNLHYHAKHYTDPLSKRSRDEQVSKIRESMELAAAELRRLIVPGSRSALSEVHMCLEVEPWKGTGFVRLNIATGLRLGTVITQETIRTGLCQD